MSPDADHSWAGSGRASAPGDPVLALLEFPKVLAALCEGAMSPLGAAAAEALRPSTDAGQVAEALAETTEARTVLERVGPFPLGDLPDLGPRLAVLRAEGAVLPAPELVEVLHAVESAISARRALRAAADLAPRLAARAERLVELPHLAAAIRRAVGPQYEILDEASPELARIRAERERVRGQVQGALERLLQDDVLAPAIQDRVVTQRNERYVIPVKASHRGVLSGVVHDQSQSRATVFVEPLAVVDANNHLALLRQQEKEEEWRVLAELSAQARGHREALASNQAILAHLDLAQAKGRLSRRLEAAAPRLLPLASEGWTGLALRGARHPLLLLQAEAAEGGAARPVVPVEIVFDSTVRTVLISGANAGGKTVSLKTLGLLALMAQAGLHVPASPDSELPLFGRLFADIGDDQAIEQGLSSFSAHVRTLAFLLREAGPGSLVLLDELGTGTDPEEGSALAIAVLDRLRAQGALVVATTHLAPLKAYAYGRDGALNVAVEFDPQSLRPTYRLIYGSSGQSNAIALARGFDMPAEVIAAAEATLAGGDSRAAALLRDIETARRKAASELRRAEHLGQRAAEAARAAERREADLQARRETILAEAREAAARTVAEAEAEMRRVLDDLKARAAGAAVAPHLVAGAKGALRHARERVREALKPQPRGRQPVAGGPPADGPASPGALSAHDRVRVASLGREGEVVAVDEATGQVEVAFGSLRLKVAQDDLTRLAGPESRGAADAEAWGSARTTVRPSAKARPGLAGPSGQGGRGGPGSALRPAGRPVRPPADEGAQGGADPVEAVNVIGLRVDEALPVVDKSLDDALLAGVSRLAIIHGTGTGRLRAAIREFLRDHRAVRGVSGGDPAHGGAGVTLVDLGG